MTSRHRKKTSGEVDLALKSIDIMTVDMDFELIPSDPMCLTSCHVVLSKQGDGRVSE